VTRQQYIGALTAGAAAILAAGTALKPVRERAPQIVVADPEMERKTLRRSIEASNEWFVETARRARLRLAAVRETGATAIVWDSGGALLAADRGPLDSALHVRFEGGATAKAVVERSTPEFPLMLLRMERTQIAAAPRAVALRPGSSIVIVWPSGFLPATFGGMRSGDCGEALLTTVPLVSVPPGSAAFDLSGALAGFAIRCGGHTEVLSIAWLQRFVEAANSVEARILGRFGMRVRIPEARVIEVWEGASAGRAGVLPGDVIATDVQQLALPASRVVIEVPILRNKRRLTVRLDTRMMEGQRDLAAAGILPADRIVSVNGQPVAGRAEADRLLSRVSSAFLVVQRGERLFGVNVER
jgi:hypothetical protein